MPKRNGTGPQGKGPMTGRGKGFCVLKSDEKEPTQIEGFIGVQGKPYTKTVQNRKEVTIMPFGDGTGPAGMGPRTGRSFGYCAGYPGPGYLNPIPSRGFGFGFGRGGRGHRHLFYATGLTGWQRAAGLYPMWSGYAGAPYNREPAALTKEQELDMLKHQVEYLENTLSGVNERIRELEDKKA